MIINLWFNKYPYTAAGADLLPACLLTPLHRSGVCEGQPEGVDRPENKKKRFGLLTGGGTLRKYYISGSPSFPAFRLHVYA
jgi:hypothetical protein